MFFPYKFGIVLFSQTSRRGSIMTPSIFDENILPQNKMSVNIIWEMLENLNYY